MIQLKNPSNEPNCWALFFYSGRIIHHVMESYDSSKVECHHVPALHLKMDSNDCDQIGSSSSTSPNLLNPVSGLVSTLFLTWLRWLVGNNSKLIRFNKCVILMSLCVCVCVCASHVAINGKSTRRPTCLLHQALHQKQLKPQLNAKS